jgi:hypothetical protein
MFYFNPTAPFLRKFDKDFEKKKKERKWDGRSDGNPSRRTSSLDRNGAYA